MRKIIIPHRSKHHAINSGYAKLLDYISDVEVLSLESGIPYRFAKAISDLHAQEAGLYDSNSFLKDWNLYRMLRKNNEKYTVVHYLNAERDVRHTVKRNAGNTAIKACATFHKPPDTLQNRISKKTYLKSLDGAIAVGVNQVGFIKEWLGLDKVTYIPHGVETEFFIPADNMANNPRFLFVGQHLRDFNYLNKAIPILASKIADLQFDCIVHPDYAGKIHHHKAVNIHSNLDDLQLRSFYQKATLLFLPLLNSTACNSLLEALSCGLPIITTDVGGNREYLAKTRNFLAKAEEKDAMIETAVEWSKNEELLQKISKQNRKASKQYSWSNIADRIEEFYNTL
ncbi:hypothetical protein GCM10009117_03720 [Gangjinia marincola]|uniref:Glycosyltransferase n=1 Tax=Gangjinia marincola TaxID=578463 RepID=A0ABP3XPN1_9FLAO